MIIDIVLGVSFIAAVIFFEFRFRRLRKDFALLERVVTPIIEVLTKRREETNAPVTPKPSPRLQKPDRDEDFVDEMNNIPALKPNPKYKNRKK